MSFDIFGSGSNLDKTIIKYDTIDNKNIKHTNIINISNNDMNNILAANNIFPQDDMKWFTKFNRFGYVNPYNETANREYLFFTKPDLNIFDVVNGSTDYNNLKLNDALLNSPIFIDAAFRFKDSLAQLQSSVCDADGNINNPFMCLLSNRVSSRLDLPGINAESNESSANMYGTTIQYRSNSIKSDNGYDFNLSFTDTKYLEVYMLAKLYDEYIRLLKAGTTNTVNGKEKILRPRKKYIINRVLSEQFSIYKFIVGADGEHIIYFAKATGVYITDVPRSDMGDPGQDGFKFSLSFHAQFIEDSNPSILTDFNMLTGANNNKVIDEDIMPVYNKELSIVDNNWAGLPFVARVSTNSKDPDKRATKAAREGHGNYIYLLKWRK